MSVVQEFRDREIARLERSGWATNATLRQRLEAVGLRPPAEVVAECLDEGAGDRGGAGAGAGARWARAERAVARLREHFAPFRFSDDVDYGLLAIPASSRLDTRGTMDLNIRRGQQPDLAEDFVDPALGEGGRPHRLHRHCREHAGQGRLDGGGRRRRPVRDLGGKP